MADEETVENTPEEVNETAEPEQSPEETQTQESQEEKQPETDDSEAEAKPVETEEKKEEEEKEEKAPDKIKLGENEYTIEEIQDVMSKVEAADSLFANLQQNPLGGFFQILTKLHGDDQDKAYAYLKQVATAVLAHDLEMDAMSPEERKQRAEEQEREEKLKRLEEYEKKEALRKAREEEIETAKQVIPAIDQALQGAGLAVCEVHRQAIADAWVAAKEALGVNVPFAKLAKKIKEEYTKRDREHFKVIDPKELPEETLQRISQYNIEKAKGTKRQTTAKTKSSVVKEISEPGFIKQSEFEERFKPGR